ncbi:glycosyltransferase family 4 protein [Candidatus Falkowbacteria bacterium]|nr:glycosyltransferase family 4 protein [Candidatus Falkowbacteria bacterium]
MRIGIDASRANRVQKTGVEWYAWHIIQEFKTIIPPSTEVVLYSAAPLVGSLADLPPHWQSKVLSWPPRLLWTHFRLSWEMLWHAPDLLFVPAHVGPIGSPRRLAVTIHDVAFMAMPQAYSRQGKFYLNFFNTLDSWRAKAIITISEYSKKDIEKFYPRARGKIAVVPLAYDAAHYRVLDEPEKTRTILNRYGIRQPFFLSVSRLEVKKNTDGMIRAFAAAALPDYQLVLVGKPGRWYNQVEAALRQSQVQDSIIMPGWVAEADVPYLMNAATAFVFPSWYEGFGIPILEAMACGCPVITASTTACPEVAGGAALLVDPAADSALSRALQQIAADPVYAGQLRAKGLARAAQFSWRQTAERTWQVLQQAV